MIFPVRLLLVVFLLGLPTGVLAGDNDLPYETSGGAEAAALGTAAALWGLGWWADADSPDNRPLIPEEVKALDRSMVNSFDRSATYNWSPGAAHASDILMYSSAVAPLSLTLAEGGGGKPLTVVTMHLETLLLNGGATYLFKNLFRRSRPYVFNDDLRIPDSFRLTRTARRSFPSGHTSTAFASMVFMATVYGKLYPESESRHWVWAGCLATASVTGYLRYAAGYHYPSDILAGAALGAFAGWLVPQLHEIDRDGPDGSLAKSGMVIGLTVGF